MDITMRRLANALVFHTDPKRLVEADRVITSKMRERIPELAQLEQEAAKRRKKEISTEELTWFVEQMKTKETTVEIMNEMRKAVPEVYQALVGERDVYMAKGMDSLFSSFLPLASSPSRSSSRSSIRTMVAVIGLGHMSGVGNELVRLGWRKFNPNECL
jgi:pheromone shutdown protein TraB